MSKALPYFRWYPADAEGDDFYASLTDAELAAYHRLLNRAWMNDGIPSDLDSLARIIGKTRPHIDRMWPKLSQRWMTSPRDPSKLVNPRQEEEREKAITTSANNKRPGNANAKGSRKNRDANGAQHARARADCGSDSESNDLHFAPAAEFPETAAAIRGYFRSAPDTLVVEVAHLTVQAYVDAVSGAPWMPALTDALIAQAVHEAHFKNQENPYAYKTTVPRVVRTWAEEELRKKSTR